MKKAYIILGFLLALASTSCNDFLDVHPKGEKVEDDIFKDSQGFEDAIYGVYGHMADNKLYGMDLVWGITEILSQNLSSDNPELVALSKYDYKTNESLRQRFTKIWTAAYTNIGYTNNVLKNLNKKSPDDLPLYDVYKGEMLAARAMLHFDLLRIFASTDRSKQGIPYVKTFDFSVKPFSSVGECIDFVISDLTEAERLLENMETMAYPRDDTQYLRFNRWRETHLNLYAVQALLARVYWYTGDNANAAIYAQKVINSQKFPLVDVTEIQTYLAGVLSPKETIFGLYSTTYLDFTTEYLYTWQSYKSYAPFDNESGSNYMLPWTAIYSMDITPTMQDFRKTHFRQQAKSPAKCLKLVDYLTIENNNSPARPELISGISLIHSSEMYLIAADALLEDNYDLAFKYFNDEITSRGLTPLSNNETLTSERIYNEFRKELFCEGQQWFNMKRLKRDIISNAENRIIPASEDIYVIPIPEEEFEYRPETDQKK